MPKVSVLMTNYNGDKYISEAIESILQQTFTDFELIIVDDGSTDNSWTIIQKYSKKDARIHCYQNNKNYGISYTRNRLIDLARGEYLAFLDSDDKAYTNRLQKQVDFLDVHKQHGIVGSWIKLINETGEITGIKKLPIHDIQIRKQLYFRSPINHPTVMIRAECIHTIGYYDSGMDGAEDYDYIIRLSRITLMENIPETLLYYRIHTHNASIKKHKKTIQKTLLVRKKMKKLGYQMGFLEYLSYAITWIMQFFSPRIVVPLFYFLIKIFPTKK